MYQSFSGDFFPQQIGDLIWAEMCANHEQAYSHYQRDESGRFIDDPDGDVWYCYTENGPDGQEYEYELECFVHADPCWVTPSLVL